MNAKDCHGITSLIENLLIIDAYWEKKSQFTQWSGHWKTNDAQADDPTSVFIQPTTINGLSTLLKRAHEISWNSGCKKERLWRGLRVN